MRKIVLLLAIVFFCSSLFAVELKNDEMSKTKTAIQPLFALGIILIFNVAELEDLTRGYISLNPAGVFSAEKYYEKDGVELRLLGMAHVAEKGFYEDIKNSLRGKPALMLMEGVTDDESLLKTPPDYSSIAKKLGADNQRDKFSPKEMPDNVELIRADLDVSDFSADTVEILNLVGKIYSKEGFSFGTLLMMHLKLSDSNVAQAFMKDLVENRNNCLIGHLQKNLEKHKLILVPWGALHLPGIEKWVQEDGFALKTQKSRAILRFPDYFKYFMPEKGQKNHSLSPLKTLSEVLGM